MAASKKPLDPKEAALKSVQWAMQSPAHLLTYLGFDVFPQQLQTQEAVLNNQKVAIRGCHSSGKTFFMAGVAVWWVLRNNPALVLSSASRR